MHTHTYGSRPHQQGSVCTSIYTHPENRHSYAYTLIPHQIYAFTLPKAKACTKTNVHPPTGSVHTPPTETQHSQTNIQHSCRRQQPSEWPSNSPDSCFFFFLSFSKSLCITLDSTSLLTLHTQAICKVHARSHRHCTPWHRLSSEPLLQLPPPQPRCHRCCLQSVLHMTTWSKRPVSVLHGTGNKMQTP